jgi:hypothetical protein
MGLDWNPLGKPQRGREREFYDLLGRVTVEKWLQPSPIQQTPLPEGLDRAAGREYRKGLWAQLEEITISPYETLGAPRVGDNEAADAWIRGKYEKAPNKPASIDEWVQKFQGYYVTELLPGHDGFPVYSNWPLGGNWERWSFRAQFFRECEDVLDRPLLDEAWLHHTASQLADYGMRLMAWAAAYAEKDGVTRVLRQRELDAADNRALGPWLPRRRRSPHRSHRRNAAGW